jgi:oligopeptide transport system substrate-binding protein
MKKLFVIIILFFIPLGCGKNNPPSDSELPRIFFRLTENPVTLDPAQVVDVTGGELCAKMFSGLVRYDENLKIVPDLAQTFKISDDGKAYTFQLREDLRFSDGTPLTASDVLFSWKRLLSPLTLSPRNWVLNMIQGAPSFIKGESKDLPGLKTPDKRTIEIRLEKPFAPFLSLLTMPAAAVLPSGYYQSRENDSAHAPRGSGPYLFDQWETDVQILLKPNPFYWVKSKRPVLIYKIVPEEASALAMLSAGELDIIKLPRQQSKEWKRQFPSFHFSSVEELNTYYIGFDLRKPWLDLPFRKAVAAAVNSKELIDSVMGGQAVPATSPVPSLLMKGIPPFSGIPYSEENARLLLSQSQARNKKLVFLNPSVKETVSIASIIQDKLKRLGLSIEMKVYDWSSFKDALSRGEGDLFVLSWWADYADPENFLFPTFYSGNKGPSGNRVYYENKKTDSLLLELQNQIDPVQRTQVLSSIVNQVREDLPWVPLWHRVSVYAIAPRVRHFTPFPLYSMDKGLDLSVDEKNE